MSFAIACASSRGRHILELGADAAQSQDAVDVVSAVVGVKSLATLVERANAFGQESECITFLLALGR